MKHGKNFLRGSLALVALFSASCAKESLENVNPQSVVQNHRVSVIEGEDTAVSSYLEFGQGGLLPTRLDLAESPKASFVANGEKLNKIFDTTYSHEFRGEKLDHEIVFTDKDGVVYKNQVTVKPVRARGPLPTELSKSATTEIFFDGEPLEGDEEISMMISGRTADDKGLSLKKVTASPGNPRLVVTPADLAGFKTGPAGAHLEREVHRKIQNGTKGGGRTTAIYTTRAFSVQIKN